MRCLISYCFFALWISLPLFRISTDAYTEQMLPNEDVVGEAVNIAGFGRWLSGDNYIGRQWDNPRDIYEVRISGIDRRTAESLRLEWWGSVWPANGTGGWMRLDDPWNGRWVQINAIPVLYKSGQFVFKFPPLSKEEWPQALKLNQYPDKKQPVFRNTLKVRLIAESKNVIETRFSHDGTMAGSIELTNGVLVDLQSLPQPRSVQVDRTGWKTQGTAGGSAGVRIKILYTGNEDLNSNDLTRITVRLGPKSRSPGFSFVPQDVLNEGIIRLPDFGTIVTETCRKLTLANDSGPSGDKWRRPVRGRILEKPEMTREMALQGIPRLSPLRWVPLGVPSARQEFLVGPNGDWKISALSLNTDKGRDARRWVFNKNFGKKRLFDELAFLLDTRQKPEFDGGDRREVRRYLEDGHLPLIHVQWRNGPLQYHHALAATILLGDYGDDISRRGDETVVFLSRLQITNTSSTKQLAGLNLKYSINVPLDLQENGVIAVKSVDSNAVDDSLFALRGVISMGKPIGGGVANWTVQSGSGPESSAILHWQGNIEPGRTRSIYFKTPFVELLDAKELARLKKISFEDQVPKVLSYWRRRLAKGMTIDVPDPALNDFYKANLWHNVITTDRDPQTGLYNQGVATIRYRVFANETVMIARSMDMRGEHLEAERFLEPMLHYQGHEAL
ncbi:MAG: hypothetical protein ACYTDW_22070, partial [Planctomycetota bacterium]